LLTRFAHAVEFASAAEAVALALDANTGMPAIAATAAVVATASLQPRRRPFPGLIVMLPYVARPAGVVVDEPCDATAGNTPECQQLRISLMDKSRPQPDP
jgi:hypothetical protein